MFRRNLSPMPCSSQQNQSGAAMIETVVSLFMLAVGLMGTLAMQVKGVNSNQRANLVTEANILAADMADRILAYNSDDIASDDDDYAGIYTGSGNAQDNSSCLDDGCDSSEQKTLDTYQWGQAVSSSLPGGTGEVQYADGVYTVVLKWSQSDTFVDSTCSGIGDDLQDTSTEKACFAYQFRL